MSKYLILENMDAVVEKSKLTKEKILNMFKSIGKWVTKPLIIALTFFYGFALSTLVLVLTTPKNEVEQNIKPHQTGFFFAILLPFMILKILPDLNNSQFKNSIREILGENSDKYIELLASFEKLLLKNYKTNTFISYEKQKYIQTLHFTFKKSTSIDEQKSVIIKNILTLHQSYQNILDPENDVEAIEINTQIINLLKTF
jgi:hypothetical protein